jgi:glyoxylase-like metal-dependent hydrolase (beta-lactamase superfamily II)
MLADASPVDVIVQPGPHEVAGIALEAIPLFGHSPGQLGYLVGDVFFCADVVLPASVLEKYRIPYLFSLTDHLQALHHAATIPHRVAVPGHGAILEASVLADVIVENRALADRVLDATLELTATPQTASHVLQALLQHFGAPVADAPSFFLLQPTAFAFLSHLHREGLVQHEVSDGASLWTRV